MSIENAGLGGGAGLVGGLFISILIALGLRERVTVLEKLKLDEKVFREFQTGLDMRLERMERLLEKIHNGKR